MMARVQRANGVRKRRATLFDKAAGVVILRRRKAAGFSQVKLAGLCGVAFQQLQKYENGSNRISLGRFVRIANALGIAPSTLISEIVYEGQTP